MSYMDDLATTVRDRLADLGYDVTDLEEATASFKRANGFRDRPYPGPLTIASLFSESAKPAAVSDALGGPPPWYDELYAVLGMHERSDNADLRAWLSSDGATLGDPAQFPWCGDGVQTAIKRALPDEPVPANPYLAMNWASWGVKVEPTMGAVMSFWRGSPTSIYGHVALYAGEDSEAYHVLGGNQSNAVTITRIAKNRLRKNGCRWPSTYPLPGSGRVQRDAVGALSTNEA